VEESDHWLDSVGEQLIDHALIILQAFLVDGIIAAAQRNHSRPGDAETVGLGTKILEESDVLFVAVVGVTCSFSTGPICYLARYAAERVPD